MAAAINKVDSCARIVVHSILVEIRDDVGPPPDFGEPQFLCYPKRGKIIFTTAPELALYPLA